MKKIAFFILLFLCLASGSFAQWSQIGPTRSSISPYFISGDTIFAGHSQYGFYYSTDNGTTWCETDLSGIGIGAISRSNGITVAGGGDIYRTTDNGQSFTTIATSSILSISIKGNLAIAGSSTGVYVSSDAGVNWTRPATLNTGVIWGAAVIGNTMIAGSTDGVYRSNNNGFSFTSVLSPRFVNQIVAADSVVYVCSNGGIEYSTNQGLAWNSFPLAMNTKCLAINGNALYAIGMDSSTVMKSTDNGNNWTPCLYGASSIISSNNILIANTGGSLLISTNNGTSWAEKKYHFMEAYAVMKTPTAIYTSSTVYGAYRSTDNGANWALVNQVYPFGHLRSFIMKGSKLFAGTNGSGVYVSTNDGLKWGDSTLLNQTVYALYTLGSNIYAGTAGSGIFYTTNDGANWTSVTGSTTIYSITSNGSRIFAGGTGGVLFSDNSVNWNSISFPVPNIGGVAAIGNRVFAGGTAGIYISTDNGFTWSVSSFPYPNVNTLAASGNVVFAGCEKYGFFVSQDLGQTWRSINGNLGNRISVSRISVSGSELYAATYRGSIMKAPISGLVGMSTPIENELIKDFTLMQNYPNPFNPVTQINYELNKSGFVILKIFDINGKEITELVNEKQSEGSYWVIFDAGKLNLASGIYFYKMSTNDFVDTKRMVLVK